MFTRVRSFCQIMFVALCLTGLSLMFIAVLPAQAQGDEPPAKSACFECHQTQYFLYDSGNWVFFETMHGRCVDCHNGQGDTWDKEAAHTGMVANPLQDNQAACQRCHGDEYQAHRQAMTAKGHFKQHGPVAAGYSSAAPPPPPAAPAAVGIEPWRQAALAVIGLAFVAVFVFGCRCWREDRAMLHQAAA